MLTEVSYSGWQSQDLNPKHPASTQSDIIGARFKCDLSLVVT